MAIQKKKGTMFANTVGNHRDPSGIWRRERHLFARLKMVGKAGGPGVVSGSRCATRVQVCGARPTRLTRSRRVPVQLADGLRDHPCAPSCAARSCSKASVRPPPRSLHGHASMAVAQDIAVVVRWQERCAPPMARFTCLTILDKDGV